MVVCSLPPYLQLGVGEDEGSVEVEEFAAVPASDGLVSYLPQFSEFGQFRTSNGWCSSLSVVQFKHVSEHL